MVKFDKKSFGSRRCFNWFCLLLLCFCILAAPEQAMAGTYKGRTAEVVSGNIPLKMRKGPSTSYAVKRSLKSGSRVTIIKKVDEWYLVTYNKTRGYCYGKYLKLSKKKSVNSAAKRTGSGNAAKKGAVCRVSQGEIPLKLRKAPSTESKILSQIPRGSSLRIKAWYNNDWYKAVWKGKTGYVSSDYIILPKGVRVGKEIPRHKAKAKKTAQSSKKSSTGKSGKKTVAKIKKTYLGKSGQGRKIYSYRVGHGKNHLVVTAGLHGWEDAWAKDSCPISKTARKLLKYGAKHIKTLNKYDYSIIVIPRANPDGYFDGYSHDGPGRCTTSHLNRDNKLVKGGIDLNRCFPTGFQVSYDSRTYTGDEPLAAREAIILQKWLKKNKGSGRNIYVDMHGWYNQTITIQQGYGQLYNAFAKYFPGTRPASYANGAGYAVSYAYSLGYNAVLFEFPHVSGSDFFFHLKYDQKFIKAAMEMIKTIR